MMACQIIATLVLSFLLPLGAPPSTPDWYAAYQQGDHGRAYELLYRDGDQRDAAALFNLGLLRYRGEGTAKSPMAAARLWRQAADRGIAEARNNLAVMVARHEPSGFGDRAVAERRKIVLDLLNAAARQGLATAQKNLGFMYFSWCGEEDYPNDPGEAYYWLRLARRNGADVPQDLIDGLAKHIGAATVAKAEGRLARHRPEDAGEPELDPIDEPRVTVSRANVRKAPDVRSPRLHRLAKGTTVIALGRVKGGKWMLVARDDEILGYVLESKLAAETTAETAEPARVDTADFGRYHALVIGNNDYERLPDLLTAVPDARAVGDVLRNRYGFQTTVLLNATRAHILGALTTFRRRLTDGDNLLVYFAGHGWLDGDADRGYWLPVDAVEGDPTNWVSNATITDAVRAMQARHVVVIADSCFSGTLTRGIKISVRRPDFLDRMAEKKSRTVLTSGGLEPVIDSGGGNHSVFARTLLETLDGNREPLDGQKLFSLIRRPVMVNSDQTPEYGDIRKAGHDGGDFLFVPIR